MSIDSTDTDQLETQEWLDALDSLIQREGTTRAQFILEKLLNEAMRQGVQSKLTQFVTDYRNTISADDQPTYPGDLEIETAIDAAIRWNAIMMVVRAKKHADVGGHLSSYASIATLYEVGLNHFFRATNEKSLGDLIFFQGHSSEGNYARAYLESRLPESFLNNFRQETNGDGVSSYPHPWLMPTFWQFATVSLGLGMMQGIYQARFLKYLDHRNLLKATDRKVWVFCGDGEMDEVDATGALSLASREKLDNLIFVVNCNMQRLDGLVRGNGQVVQELESIFRGAGWHVIKVMWNSAWDDLFANDVNGALAKRLTECIDGELQYAYTKDALFMREFIFNSPELKALVADWSDEKIATLGRGAHDPLKVYAAYKNATEHKNQPTVILALGVKGFGLGTHHSEGRNTAHNALEMSQDDLKSFVKRFNLPIQEADILALNYYKPKESSKEIKYLKEKRAALNGFLPSRHVMSLSLKTPALSAFDVMLQGFGDRVSSTTMALGRILNTILKDETIGSRVVPIFSDEVRTFGMEALFRQVGIYSPVGQLYTPEDKEQFLFYKEAVDGQVLEEGITEAGCASSWIAAATSYSTNQFPMVPFFTFYSMFGFQRVGDYFWAASDMRARGFLIGATAGRTTLEGEGLQHQDGTSLLIASTFPSVRAYDPAFAYEMAVIIQHGLKEMFQEEKDVIYYVMAMNEKYIQPPMPKGAEKGIIKGMYLYDTVKPSKLHVQLLGSGAILNEVIAAQTLLKNDFKITADVWSVTSFAELRRDAENHSRDQLLQKKSETPYVMQCLEKQKGPIIASTDYVRAYADLIRPFLENKTYVTLGTDGYGRSDTRKNLRAFFEVDRYYIVIAALHALSLEGKLKSADVKKAMKKYGIDGNKPNPVTV